ncbi:MAG TPA: isochorismate synthase [Chloroflexota bacterium]|nr:isochorismate synthase [Chloroflexota bacterium]
MPIGQDRSKLRHETILEAALHVFSRKGYHDAAMDDIAAEAQTSKGGLYFHFPGKQTVFLALLDRMAQLLRSRVEAGIAAHSDPVLKAQTAIWIVLQTFSSHRTLGRLFLVETPAAGREFQDRMATIRADFADLVTSYLELAVEQRLIAPLDTAVAGQIWSGALYEVIAAWLMNDSAGRLEDRYPTLRLMLLNSVGILPLPARPSDPTASSPATPSFLPAYLDEERVLARFDDGRDEARRLDRPVLVSITVNIPSIDPLAVFERGAAVDRERRFWSAPNATRTIVGLGVAWTVETSGMSRFADAAAAWMVQRSGAVVDVSPGSPVTGPVLLAGFSFDPERPSTDAWSEFPDGLLVLPRFAVTSVGRQSWLTINAITEPDADGSQLRSGLFQMSSLLSTPGPGPRVDRDNAIIEMVDLRPPEDWQAMVGAIAQRLRAGESEKVVLALSSRLSAQHSFDPSRALDRLREDYPNCYVFAVDRGNRCFLGASPEQLALVEGATVRTVCLAGSTARGATIEEDDRLGDELLASAKNRSEHAIVVRWMRETLTQAGIDPSPMGDPALLKFRNVQHLYTPVDGQLPDGGTVLDVVERLHPTPSVGGKPREAALALIREYECLDRGWYAGAVGWLDAVGQGEFAVAIRSALIQGSTALLFAGCGIVPDSVPEQEYAEARLKLRPMLSALGASQR